MGSTVASSPSRPSVMGSGHPGGLRAVSSACSCSLFLERKINMYRMMFWYVYALWNGSATSVFCYGENISTALLATFKYTLLLDVVFMVCSDLPQTSPLCARAVSPLCAASARACSLPSPCLRSAPQRSLPSLQRGRWHLSFCAWRPPGLRWCLWQGPLLFTAIPILRLLDPLTW